MGFGERDTKRERKRVTNMEMDRDNLREWWRKLRTGRWRR